MRIHSAKETWVPPSTCQMHVSPGVTSNRDRSQPWQWFDSSHGSGRGPTIVMSPFNTFHNCGNSSMLDQRKNLPTGVVRGSTLILKAGPS